MCIRDRSTQSTGCCAAHMHTMMGDPDDEQTPLTEVVDSREIALQVVPSSQMDDSEIVSSFPPLATPKSVQLGESIMGFVVVNLIIFWILGLTHFITLPHMHGDSARNLSTFLYVCAVLAESMLLGIMFVDPGVIQRTPENCLPLPTEVSSRLAAGQTLEDLENIHDVNDEDRTFCMRCCVWRPKGSHHCSTCARCVTQFDHHCGVFGRCIAGDPFTFCGRQKPVGGKYQFGCFLPEGNMWMFIGIITIGGISSMVCYLFVFLSLVYYRHPK
eukprot:TRINITY_DN22959_c0_g1_i1.p1 TRINITY_DN22959_c0_g1~~TRINITY_DN22959_c0_g1_i1.p1  ORF type:complete len:272 (-),score=52.05 TRINITY_DN22959_c0_g1_i1:267-1082(-)